jgi:hypothetical protein
VVAGLCSSFPSARQAPAIPSPEGSGEVKLWNSMLVKHWMREVAGRSQAKMETTGEE